MAPLRRLMGPGVEGLVTGVGLTAATWALTSAVLRRRPRFLLQSGLGGALDPAFPLLLPLLIASDFPGDEGVEEGGRFRSTIDLGLRAGDDPPYTGGRLLNPLPLEEYGFAVAAGVTVQEVTTRPERLAHYRLQGAAAESMEGAALHYVALKEGIPFVQLRVISNEAGERDKGKWALKAALDALGPATEELIKKLNAA